MGGTNKIGSPCVSCLKEKLSQAKWLVRDNVAQDIINSLSDEEIRNLPTDLKKQLFKALIDGHISSRDSQALKRLLENKRFDEAGWLERDNIARKEINGMTDSEVAKLSNEKKIAYLRALQSGYMSDADKAAQRKIYRNMPLEKDFKKFDDQKRNELVKKLKSDKIVQNAQKNWSKLTEKEKLAAMQQVVKLQADTYGFSKTPEVKLYDKAPKNGMISNGTYKGSKIHLNKNKDSKFGTSFEKAVNVVTHEAAHHYQHELAEKFEKGKIPKSDPAYEQAKLFAINNESYVPSKEEFNTYQKQPLENHANRTGSKIEKSI